MRYFVFLEFLDPIVERTLRQLRDALQPWKRSKSPVHVTVRGPYKNEPDPKTLHELAVYLQGQGVRIIGAGVFAHKDSFSVFLRAESAVFREIWWKPDFRAPLENIQPHLTMFESSDKLSAMLALNFLRASKISILTHAVQLTIYSPGQPDLFEAQRSEGGIYSQLKPEIVAIDPEIIPAAYEVGERLQQRHRDLIAVKGSDA